MRISRVRILVFILLIAVALIPFRHRIRSILYRDTFTVAERLEQYEDQAKQRLLPLFQKVKVEYPPAWMGIVAIKDKKQLEVWVASENGDRVLLRDYPILASSGGAGPKLREGDYQVPEGVYKVEALNPNSMYHLSLRVNYPNKYDRQKAKDENRTNLGGDIMIHGNQVSIGCLAMGDEAIEEIFVMAANIWPSHIPIVISPVDFRKDETVQEGGTTVSWIPSLYQTIQETLEEYK